LQYDETENMLIRLMQFVHRVHTCLGGSGDWDKVRTDRDGLSEEQGFNSPGRPVDFVFGFQGCMLWD